MEKEIRCTGCNRRNRINGRAAFQEKINWPDGYRMAVVLTFDFQGGEDVKPDKNGKINHEEWTQGEYGPRPGSGESSHLGRDRRERDVSHLRRHC